MSKTLGPSVGQPVGSPVAGPTVLAGVKNGNGGGGGVDPFTGTPSDIIDIAAPWLLADSPVTINGGVWTCDSDAGGGVYTGYISHRNQDTTGKYYAEAEWTVASTGGTWEMFGWRSATYLTNAWKRGLVGVIWDYSEGTWQIHRDVLDLEGGLTTTNTTAPVDGTRVGVAVDQVARKLYGHVNGIWLTDGVNGGAPSGGAGWSLVVGSATMYLFGSARNLGLTMTALDSTELLPAGYTAET